jgi:hypothetical protein
MARAKAAKIGFRQVNTKSSLEKRKIFTAVWSEKSPGKSGNGVSRYAASWRFLIRSPNTTQLLGSRAITNNRSS